MNLKDKINEDLIAALKSGNGEVASALRFLMSAIKNRELEKRTKLSKEGKPQEELEKLSELTEEELTNVIFGEIKKGGKAVGLYEKGGRLDLVLKGKSELEILKKYLSQ